MLPRFCQDWKEDNWLWNLWKIKTDWKHCLLGVAKTDEREFRVEIGTIQLSCKDYVSTDHRLTVRLVDTSCRNNPHAQHSHCVCSYDPNKQLASVVRLPLRWTTEWILLKSIVRTACDSFMMRRCCYDHRNSWQWLSLFVPLRAHCSFRVSVRILCTLWFNKHVQKTRWVCCVASITRGFAVTLWALAGLLNAPSARCPRLQIKCASSQ